MAEMIARRRIGKKGAARPRSRARRRQRRSQELDSGWTAAFRRPRSSPSTVRQSPPSEMAIIPKRTGAIQNFRKIRPALTAKLDVNKKGIRQGFHQSDSARGNRKGGPPRFRDAADGSPSEQLARSDRPGRQAAVDADRRRQRHALAQGLRGQPADVRQQRRAERRRGEEAFFPPRPRRKSTTWTKRRSSRP